MALTKVNYVDNQTIIGATNLNAIQDEIIANAKTIASKQNTLSSGVNIKSINGESILGSGDLTVTATVTVDNTVTKGSTNPVSGGAVYTAIQSGGGSGGSSVKYITTSTTISEIVEAISDGYEVKLQIGTAIYELSMYSETARVAAFTRLVNTRDTSGNEKVTCTQYAYTDGGVSHSSYDLCGEATKVISAGGDTLETLKAGTNINISDEGYISASGGSGSGATIELNGTSTTAASFYAPTGGGSSETTQYLKSNGSGAAPTWEDMPESTKVYINSNTELSTTARVYTPLTAGTSGQFLMSNGDGKVPTWGTVSSSGSSLYVSVADYIKAHGETIDAINAAIADCPEHGTVYIPNLGSGHSYEGSNSVSITKAMTLLGNFYGFNFESTDTLIEYTGTDYAIKGSCAGICLKNIKIHTANGGGVWIGDSSVQCYDTNVENVTCLIDNHTRAGFIFTHGFKSLFRNCYTNGGIIGFYFTGTTPTDDPTNLTSITVENCWACNYTNYGYQAENVYYSSFINCAADNAGLLVPKESDPRRIFKEGYGVCAYMINGCYGLSLVNCGCEFTASEACRIYDSNEIEITMVAYATNQASGTSVDSSQSVFFVSGSTVMFSNTRPFETTNAPKRWVYDISTTSSKLLFHNCSGITYILKGTSPVTIDGFSGVCV